MRDHDLTSQADLSTEDDQPVGEATLGTPATLGRRARLLTGVFGVATALGTLSLEIGTSHSSPL